MPRPDPALGGWLPNESKWVRIVPGLFLSPGVLVDDHVGKPLWGWHCINVFSWQIENLGRSLVNRVYWTWWFAMVFKQLGCGQTEARDSQNIVTSRSTSLSSGVVQPLMFGTVWTRNKKIVLSLQSHLLICMAIITKACQKRLIGVTTRLFYICLIIMGIQLSGL